MTDLPGVTLLAIDSRTPELALAALRRCCAGLRFASVKLLTDQRLDAPDVEVVLIPRLADSADYSTRVQRELLPHVDTPHLLIAQWDGFVVDPARWDDAFLAWDYLGAPWGFDGAGTAGRVGNGGFSLRSRRLLQALQDPSLAPHHPEDVSICVTHRAALESRHGIRFAPPELAARFAFEDRLPTAPTFGFHGAVNLPDVLPRETLSAWIAALPGDWFAGRDAFKLARRLVAVGDAGNARTVLNRRQAAGARDWRTRWLRARHRLGAGR
jgi:hypothetical protein